MQMSGLGMHLAKNVGQWHGVDDQAYGFIAGVMRRLASSPACLWASVMALRRLPNVRRHH